MRAGFDALREGDPVNVELSLGSATGSAAISCTDTSTRTRRSSAKLVEGQGHRLEIERPPSIGRFIVEKGFIAIDGVSLTIASVSEDAFTIALIPETSRRTTLGAKAAGARVNIEIDPVARYAFAAVDAYRQTDDSGAVTHDELAWAYEI